MNKFQVFIDENKDILNDFAKKYIEKTDMPELLKKSISYSLVNDGKKIRPLSFLYLLKYYGEDFAEYFDVALAIDADGVHIGQSDMPCDVTCKLVGPNKIVGVSAATIDEAKKAEKDGADYIGTGAVFPTATKEDAPKITKNDLKEIVESINIPVVAIGGITLDNASELTDTGIKGLSVVSAIMSSDNPRESAEKLLNIFNS